MRLFFDTETSGLPNFKLPSSDPSQPFLVEFAGILVDDEGKEFSSLHAIIRPPQGGIIPDDVAKIHGITTERAREVGIALDVVVDYFEEAVRTAKYNVVAHNVSFDLKIMKIAMKKPGATRERFFGVAEVDELFKKIQPFCTMKSSKKLVNAPPTEKMVAAGFNTPKNPTLGECYRHFFGEELENAHGALADVRACRKVFNALQKGVAL